jgi:hypothetical protein
MSWHDPDGYSFGDPYLDDAPAADDWRARVPRLNRSQVRRAAAVLLSEYGAAHGPVAEPPVPVDEIVEVHLRLAVNCVDLRAAYPGGEVLGTISFAGRAVEVDVSLDPSADRRRLGRYRFTLAHEAGHWQLHRRLFLAAPHPYDDAPARPSFVCRSADAKEPVEWQADYFAAHLLMPSALVRAAWEAWRGDLRPVGRDALLAAAPPPPDGVGPVAAAARRFARPLAERFEASADAMRIRLQELGLVPRDERPINAR